MAKIAVLLPVRNGAATIREAIESIRAQTYENWVLVVVDDHSTDGTGRIVEEYAALDSRVRFVAAGEESGIVAALNRGLKECGYEYVARMDADDICLPDRLARQLAYLEEKRYVGVVACRTLQDGGGDGYRRYVDWLNSLVTEEDHSHFRFVESPVAHPSVMFRRELVDRFGGYLNGDFPEDYELWLRWMDEGVAIAKLPECLLEWRDSAQRLSRTDSRYSPERFYRLKCRYLDRWLTKKLEEGRELWLWGAGRVTRKRFRHLEELGWRFSGYLDIDPKKVGRNLGGRPVEDPRLLERLEDRFILLGVGSAGARDLAMSCLTGIGGKIGRDFLPVA